MLTNEELIAEYTYLDDLDCRGQAWELLRRSDEYRADYNRLQTFERPEPFDSEHVALAKKWHVRRLLDPASRKVPQFFHAEWEKITYEFIQQHPLEWRDLEKEKDAPGFKLETLKHSIICKDLKDRGCSLNKIARRLYSGFLRESDNERHDPARHRVRGDLQRFEKLQAEYIKIAFSDI